MAKFMFLDGLAFKTWRMVEGEWFEGTYVFDEKVYRDDFQREFSATAAESAGSGIIGSPRTLIEPFEVVAIAEGPGRLPARPRPRHRLTLLSPAPAHTSLCTDVGATSQ